MTSQKLSEDFFQVTRTGHPKYGQLFFTNEQKKYIIEKYFSDNVQSAETIAVEFNVSPRTICKIIREAGYELKTLRSYRKVYEHDDDFFETIDTEEKAYWLGFLYADGNIDPKTQRVALKVSSVDKEILYKLKESLKSTGVIENKTRFDREYNKTRYISALRIQSPKMVKDLISKGCTPRKTFTLKFPTEEQVPYHLLRHFVRGYTDGDGAVMLRPYEYGKIATIHWVGTFNIIFGIKNYLNLNGTLYNPSGKNTFNVSCGGNIAAPYIIRYLYADATIYLERKYNKYLEIEKYIEENPPRQWINYRNFT